VSDDGAPTCGRGLAANAPLPAAVAGLLAALATVLEVHMGALDLSDPMARREHEAYADLVKGHRAAAAGLQATAARMTGCRDLPMAAHDMAAMRRPEVLTSFERFVRVEEDLRALLDRRLPEDRAMVEAMRS